MFRMQKFQHFVPGIISVKLQRKFHPWILLCKFLFSWRRVVAHSCVRSCYSCVCRFQKAPHDEILRDSLSLILTSMMNSYTWSRVLILAFTYIFPITSSINLFSFHYFFSLSLFVNCSFDESRSYKSLFYKMITFYSSHFYFLNLRTKKKREI